MAVAYDAVTSSYSTGVVSSLSWSHVPSGTPTAVGVGVGWWNGNTNITDITYGGTSMGTVVVSAQETSNGKSALYALANPSSGTQTVAITWSSGVVCGSGAVTVTGSDTTTATSNSNSATGSSTTPSVTCTSATNDLVMDSAYTGINGDAVPGSGQTERYDDATYGGNARVYGSTEAGASSVTMDWTAGNSGWAIVAMSFKSDGAPPIGGPSLRISSSGLVW